MKVDYPITSLGAKPGAERRNGGFRSNKGQQCDDCDRLTEYKINQKKKQIDKTNRAAIKL
jgi:hypothetical protein